jgi:hypothetical protein
MKTRRTKVTVEKERLLIVSRQRQVAAWCEACRSEVKMIGAEEASVLTGLSQRAIFRLIEADQLHFSETRRGALLICLNSLLAETSTESARSRRRATDDTE